MRRAGGAVLAAGWLVVACPAIAAEISVAAARGVAPTTVVLHTHRLDGSADEIRQEVQVPGAAHFALPAGLFEIDLDAPGFWAAPVQLRNNDSGSLKVWKTAPLSGSITEAKGLRVRFTPYDPDGASGEAACDTESDRWTCNIPPGRYDLRFSSAGSAPEFRFDTVVPQAPGQAALRLQFVAGASLMGRVEPAARISTPLADAEVSLTPATGEASSAKQTVRANGKGFFQFKGLSPGDYVVHAGAKGLATRNTSVKVVGGLAAELSAPLILDKPKQLTVTVVPRVDPSGRPWRVQLIARDKRLRQFEVLSESNVTPSGQWTHPRLFAGEYGVVVSTAGGGRWRSDDVTIEQDDVNVVIAALAARIDGEITLGDRPLKASLSFGGEGGIKISSDDDGRFEGEIPNGDATDKSERLILVEAESPNVRRTIKAKVERDDGGLHVRVKLPATTLMGRVLNMDRSPEPHAIITVTRDDPEVFEQTFGESDGSFQIAGFAPGTYKVTADGFQKTSKSLPVELHVDQTAEVELVVERYEHVQGRMTVGDAPVIAAQVYALSRDTWSPTVPTGTTNESGYFQMDLPPGTTTFDGVAVHPAFDIILGRSVIQKDKQMHLRAQQLGGTLNIESPAGGGLLVMHNGGEFSANWLAGLAGGSVAPDHLSIPRLQPGQYSVCTPKDKKCASGYLAPHGTLTLALASN